MGVAEVRLMPITEAPVVVPVPMFVVRLRIVLDVRTVGALPLNMPSTCDAAPVAVSWIEFATLPPIVLPVALQIVDAMAECAVTHRRRVMLDVM